MSSQIQCPRCGRRFEIPRAGIAALCPYCGRTLSNPGARPGHPCLSHRQRPSAIGGWPIVLVLVAMMLLFRYLPPELRSGLAPASVAPVSDANAQPATRNPPPFVYASFEWHEPDTDPVRHTNEILAEYLDFPDNAAWRGTFGPLGMEMMSADQTLNALSRRGWEFVSGAGPDHLAGGRYLLRHGAGAPAPEFTLERHWKSIAENR